MSKKQTISLWLCHTNQIVFFVYSSNLFDALKFLKKSKNKRFYCDHVIQIKLFFFVCLSNLFRILISIETFKFDVFAIDFNSILNSYIQSIKWHEFCKHIAIVEISIFSLYKSLWFFVFCIVIFDLILQIFLHAKMIYDSTLQSIRFWIHIFEKIHVKRRRFTSIIKISQIYDLHYRRFMTCIVEKIYMKSYRHYKFTLLKKIASLKNSLNCYIMHRW